MYSSELSSMASERWLEMFVYQVCTKVGIQHMKDGLGVRIYNVQKCGLNKN